LAIHHQPFALYSEHHTAPVKRIPGPLQTATPQRQITKSIAPSSGRGYAGFYVDGTIQGYEVETTRYQIGTVSYQIRTLRDRRQFSDPDGCAQRIGISSASWPLFGVVWPAGLALAEEMSRFPIAGKHILEVGCGIGLPSLVLQQRGANITACDYHPLAEEFLRKNTDLNGLAPIPFFNAPWLEPTLELGRFDLIIGSDLLYERNHPIQLADFLAGHARPTCQILLTDPGRHRCSEMSARLTSQGYGCTEMYLEWGESLKPSHRGHLLNFVRCHTPS
jgi:predicted nicotinamide N-methyase